MKYDVCEIVNEIEMVPVWHTENNLRNKTILAAKYKFNINKCINILLENKQMYAWDR